VFSIGPCGEIGLVFCICSLDDLFRLVAVQFAGRAEEFAGEARFQTAEVPTDRAGRRARPQQAAAPGYSAHHCEGHTFIEQGLRPWAADGRDGQVGQ